MVPVAPFAQKKSGDTITRQPAEKLVFSFCNTESSPPDYDPTAATVLPPPSVPVYYRFFAGLVMCSRPKNAAVATPWVGPVVSLPYSGHGHCDPTDRQYCTNKDKGIGNDKITYCP